MKLETTFMLLRDCADSVVVRDAKCAHALVQAMDEAHAHGSNHFYKKWIYDRADEILRNEMGMEL